MARALNARRDPAWTADGFVSDNWLPISPVTGRLDAFEWKDPLAGEEHAGAVIDAERHVMLEPPAASSAAAAAASAAIAASALASAAAAASAASPAAAADAPQGSHASSPAGGEREHSESGEREHGEFAGAESLSEPPPAHAPPPVIPLVHAPDDPGPSTNAEVPPDPAPEGPDAPPADGWTRFRAMFKS
jgi:HemY protein